MANKGLFASLKSLLPRADARNEEGARAYQLPPKHALAQLAATGCFNGTFYAQAQDQLAALRILENEAGIQDVAVRAAQKSLDLSNTRYEGGYTRYLEVITAQNTALTDEVTAVNILGRRMASAVLLIEALGGGWDNSRLPTRPECCGKLARTGN